MTQAPSNFDETPSKSVPSAVESEAALIGCVLINPGCWPEMKHIDSSMFFLHKHRWIWQAFAALYASGIDYLTVSDSLSAQGRLEEIGGAAYLIRLINSVPTSVNSLAYAATVEETATRRFMLEAAQEIAKRAYDEKLHIDDALKQSVEIVRGVQNGRSTGETLVHVSQIAHDSWLEVQDPDKMQGDLVRLGLGNLDDALGGGQERGTLLTLAGRPGMGKTAAMCKMADDISEAGGGVFFFSKEMGAKQIIKRMAFRRARVNWQAWKAGKYKGDQGAYNRLVEAYQELSARPGLFIDDRTNQSTDEVFRQCDIFAQKFGRVDAILADHYRLFSDSSGRDDEVRRLGAISWAYKTMARDFGCAVIAAAQLSRVLRERDDKRPTMTDIRGSGEIEENSDYIVGLHREGYYTKDVTDRVLELIKLKDREGVADGFAAEAYFEAKYGDIQPLERRHVDIRDYAHDAD